jgi:hypothetical protein
MLGHEAWSQVYPGEASDKTYDGLSKRSSRPWELVFRHAPEAVYVFIDLWCTDKTSIPNERQILSYTVD